MMERGHSGAEVNEASKEDSSWGNDLAGKGKLANEGKKFAFGACASALEVGNG